MRETIIQGDIEISYGADHVTGLFLSLVDTRLYDVGDDDSKQVSDICKSVGSGSGGGDYFDLHTGRVGFGKWVDDTTMLVFWKRYGVPDEMIAKAKSGELLEAARRG